ncbi:MAG: hypothetical protein HGGPFJEG_01873 [Ignavibacteria bacterium]|nr:hypothetical protein [Ignavibacteria bacterium]
MSDSFVKIKVFIWVVIILVILNLLTLGLVWFGKSPGDRRPPPPHPPHPEHVVEFFSKELGWNKDQTQSFKEISLKFFNESENIIDSINGYRKILFENVSNQELTGISPDSITQKIGNLQSRIDSLRFYHFREIEAICNSTEQKEKFKKLLLEFFLPMPLPENIRFGPPMRK